MTTENKSEKSKREQGEAKQKQLDILLDEGNMRMQEEKGLGEGKEPKYAIVQLRTKEKK